MKLRTQVWAWVVLGVLLCVPAYAWGVKGHTLITENAARLLPEGPLKAYVSTHTGGLSFNCLAPDFQLKDGIGGALEGPEHYINLENVAPHMSPGDLPRNRADEARRVTELGLSYGDAGFLPWRIEDMELALANAFRANKRDIVLYAGLLSHYAADATQPLHTTVDYDGRSGVGGAVVLKGIHAEYEITYLEDEGLEFRGSSLAVAKPCAPIDDVFGAALAVIFESNARVDSVYRCAEAHPAGPDKYSAWDAEIGPMTRERLACGATLVASLWSTAWEAAGAPDLR